MKRSKQVRIVVGDHHPLARLGLAHILEKQRDFQIVADCENGFTCLQAIRAQSPDVALIELDLPGLHGLEVLAAVTAEKLPTRVVILATSMEDIEIVAAAASGAFGIIMKDSPPEELVHNLREAAAGRKIIPHQLTQRAAAKGASADNTAQIEKILTHREQTVLLLVAHGMSNKEIAHRLHLAEGTVKVHLHNIFTKLGITRRAALANIVSSRTGNR